MFLSHLQLCLFTFVEAKSISTPIGILLSNDENQVFPPFNVI